MILLMKNLGNFWRQIWRKFCILREIFDKGSLRDWPNHLWVVESNIHLLWNLRRRKVDSLLTWRVQANFYSFLGVFQALSILRDSLYPLALLQCNIAFERLANVNLSLEGLQFFNLFVLDMSFFLYLFFHWPWLWYHALNWHWLWFLQSLN